MKSNPKTPVGSAPREVSAKLLGLVIDHKLSLTALTDSKSGHAQFLRLNKQDQNLAKAILITALRHRVGIGKALLAAMNRPEPKRARDLTHLFHIATAQILHMDIPASAAVNIAVTSAARNPKTKRFKGFVNAVLRNISAKSEHTQSMQNHGCQYLPPWLAKKLRSDYGKKRLLEIDAALGKPGSVDISLARGEDPQFWAERMQATILPNGSLRLNHSTPVTELPGFDEARWWVQNAASSIPAALLGDIKGKEIADLCAAPGGKTAQLAMKGAKVTAIDLSEPRLARLAQNMKRLDLDVNILAGDLLEMEPPQLYDCVLLDAPCSSTGTLRRHPDVVWNHDSQDIQNLADIQKRLLANIHNWVKPGGTIVYATCSLLKAEGEDQTAARLTSDNHLQPLPLSAEEYPYLKDMINSQGMLRALPCHWGGLESPGGLDGFYAARFQRLT